MLKNGKVFGKINIIDLLAILVAVVAIAAVAVFFLRPKSGGDTLIMKFRIEEVDEFVAEKVHVGDDLYDDTYQQELGVVTDVELDNSISYGEVVDGVYTLTSKEGYYSMIITGEVQGTKTSLGAEIGGEKYGVGHTMVLRAGDAKLYLRVYDIAVKEEDGTSSESEKPAELTPVGVSFYTPEVEDFILTNMALGDAVSDAARKTEFGTVQTLDIADAAVYVETPDGLITSAKEGFSSARIDVTVQGELTADGVKVDGRVYSVGDELNLRIGSSRLTVKICAIG